MDPVFPKVRCLLFIVGFAILILVTTLYNDALYARSHQTLLKVQSGLMDGTRSGAFMLFFYEYTNWVMIVMILSPLVSRERFWHYMLTVQIGTFLSTNVKLIWQEPRPIWTWGDELSELGCKRSYGNPSGHATRGATFCCLLVLDLFFASAWNRAKFPKHFNFRVCEHKLAFTLILLAVLSFHAVTFANILFLGKHTLNEGLLGTLLGNWAACFSHFVLRDQTFNFVSKIANQYGSLQTGKEALSFCLRGFAVYLAFCLVAGAVSLTMIGRGREYDQEWLKNLRDACGYDYEVDENGLLISDPFYMFRGIFVDYLQVTGILGLYLGMVVFRYSGQGRLSHDAFTSVTGWRHIFQLLFAAMIWFLYTIPEWIREAVEDADFSTAGEAIIGITLPFLLFGFLISYLLPLVTSKLVSYPEVTPDDKPGYERLLEPEMDAESAGQQPKSGQIDQSTTINE